VPEYIWLDGRLARAAGPHLSVSDRGFQLGDGVFETLRARRGVVIELREHLDRLRESAAATEIPLPDDERIVRGIRDLLRAEGLDGAGSTDEGTAPGDAAMRITASRGPVEGRGMAISPDAPGTIAIQVWPFAPPAAELLERGVRITIATLRRDRTSPLAGVKSTSRAESVHAKLEASRRGADDALMLTLEGELSEATSANLFLVRGRELLTPPLSAAILAGTTRTWLLEHAPTLGLAPRELNLHLEDLLSADEAFLSSSVAGIVPLTRLDERSIGAGAPGATTVRLRAAREQWIEAVSLAGAA
jgi:branched-chain amino acid aminotransferase